MKEENYSLVYLKKPLLNTLMSMWSEQQRTIFHKSAYSDIFWQWYLYHPARPTILLSCHQQLHTYMVTWYQMLEDAIVTEKLILVRCTFREDRFILKINFQNWFQLTIQKPLKKKFLLCLKSRRKRSLCECVVVWMK